MDSRIACAVVCVIVFILFIAIILWQGFLEADCPDYVVKVRGMLALGIIVFLILIFIFRGSWLACCILIVLLFVWGALIFCFVKPDNDDEEEVEKILNYDKDFE